jgi:bifunctional non-homologous end joining protein LigD
MRTARLRRPARDIPTGAWQRTRVGRTTPVPRIHVLDAVMRLNVRSATIYGEAVVCAPDGRSDFDKLHSGGFDQHVVLYAFDLIELDGEDWRLRPLEEHKARLAKLLRGDGIYLSEHLACDGAIIFEHACRMGLEGIVSKRRDFPYEVFSAGRRTYFRGANC